MNKLYILLASFSIGALLQASAATFTVKTTRDTGSGSLREAIECANACKKPSTIRFDLQTDDCGYDSEAGIWVFEPHSELPAIGSRIAIDGYSQCKSRQNDQLLTNENSARIVLELRGTSLPTRDSGLGYRGIVFAGGACGSSVAGLSITDFEVGIDVIGDSVGIVGNFIGIAPDGFTVRPNGIGIMVSHLAQGTCIGSLCPADANLIVALDKAIADKGQSTKIKGITLGLDRTGAHVITAGAIGIFSYGTCDLLVEGVVAAGHSEANYLLDSVERGTLRAVYGGTTVRGDVALGGGVGIKLCNSAGLPIVDHKSCPRVLIEQSLFSGNEGSGIVIGCQDNELRTANTHIVKTSAGVTVHGDQPLPNGEHGLSLDFAENTYVIDSILNYNKIHGLCALWSVCAHLDGCDISYNEVDGVNVILGNCAAAQDAARFSAGATLSILFGSVSNDCSCTGSITDPCPCYRLDACGNKVCC